MELLLYLLLTVLLIGLLFRFITKTAETTIHHAVEKKHRESEQIFDSGLAPVECNQRRLLRLIPRRVAKLYALKRLGSLIRYFKHTPLVEDERTRTILLDRLREVRREWKSSDWSEISQC